MPIQQRIEEVDREHLWQRHLPAVAATEDELREDVFLVCQPWSPTPGEVLWYTGQLIDRFTDFREFYVSMLDYNREEVRDLENEARSP